MRNKAGFARLGTVLALVIALRPAPAQESLQPLSSPQDPRIALLARYDATTPGRVRFAYPGSGFVLRYRGAAPVLDVESSRAGAALTLVLDGAAPVTAVLAEGRQQVATPAAPAEFASMPHTLQVIKRTETWQGIITLHAVLAKPGTELLDAPALPRRRLMFVGDSVTCGAGVARNDQCKEDPANPSTDIFNSYGMILGRRLDAQSELVCYGGRGVLRDYRGLDEKNGVLNAPQFISLAVPADDPAQRTPWNESSSAPDLIFVSLGTNDFAQQAKTPLVEADYVKAYAGLLRHLLQQYPKAPVVVTGGAITTDPLLARYIGEAVRQVNDKRLTQIPSTHYPGNSCDAHPLAVEHLHMADDIEPEIRKRLGW